MFEDLSREERRGILLAARKRYGPEFTVPRERAIEALIQNALFFGRADEWFSANSVISLLETAELPTLHLTDVEEALTSLWKTGRVERNSSARVPQYKLTQQADQEIRADLTESSRRLNRIIAKLFGNGGISKPSGLTAYFSAVVAAVFSGLGAQWAGYATGKPLQDFINFEKLEAIIDGKMQSFHVATGARAAVKRRTIGFFQDENPDFSQFKFAVGQTLYVSQLLGMDTRDLLCADTFTGGRLYLDSSVIISGLLSESRHHRVFHELRGVCQGLGIKLMIARATVDEVRNVATQQERVASELYDSVPEALIPKIRGDFFHTYLAMKSADPNVAPADVLRPFQDLPETLRSLGIEVVDDEKLEQSALSPDLEPIRQAIQAASIAIRRKPKFDNALTHDAIMFKYLRDSEAGLNEKVWFVTSDVSLPHSWNTLEPDGLKVLCFLLDGLLQSISPFVLCAEASDNFADMFSQSVAAQLIPQGKLFDIEDFMLFRDLEIDCNEMSEDLVQEGLLRVKEHVLKGAAYRQRDLEHSAYELRRFFATRRDNLETLTRERERLEGVIAGLEASIEEQSTKHAGAVSNLQSGYEVTISEIKAEHEGEIGALRDRIKGLENSETVRIRRSRSARLAFRKGLAVLILIGFLVLTTRLALSFGDGKNGFQKIASFAAFYSLATMASLAAWKWLIFRRERLKEVFVSWSEIKDLF